MLALLALVGCKAAPEEPIDFTAAHMVTQGYWYSRYNFGPVLMSSGAGVEFDLTDDEKTRAAELSGNGADIGKPFNWKLLSRISTGGDPKQGAWSDFDSGTSMEALGWAGMKETQWARQFHVDPHFGSSADACEGTDCDIPGAQQRFFGMIILSEALVQFNDFDQDRDAYNYGNDVAGHYTMLAAVADLAEIAEGEVLACNRGDEAGACDEPHSASNRYAPWLEELAPTYITSGEGAFEFAARLSGELYDDRPEPTTVREYAVAIYGLNWYGWAVSGDAVRSEEVRGEMKRLGEELAALDRGDIIESAYAARGLVAAAHANDDDAVLMGEAETAYNELIDDWDEDTGSFLSVDTYSTDDVAAIMGALSGADLHIEGSGALAIQVVAFEHMINISGLQISAPATESFIAAYEQLPSADDTEELFHRYPLTPEPGTIGKASVFAASITYERDCVPESTLEIDIEPCWSADADNFDTAGAFHLADELIWLHDDEVSGFPNF